MKSETTEIICTPEINQDTSYYEKDFRATASQIKLIMGEPQYDDNTGADKVNLEWNGLLKVEGNEDIPFTLYDWKMYRPIGMEETIDWHIGGRSESETNLVRNILIYFRQKLKYKPLPIKEFKAWLKEKILDDPSQTESFLKENLEKYGNDTHFDPNYLVYLATVIQCLTGTEEIDFGKAFMKGEEPNMFSCKGSICYGS